MLCRWNEISCEHSVWPERETHCGTVSTPIWEGGREEGREDREGGREGGREEGERERGGRKVREGGGGK